nr:NADPH-ferredoxin reductase fprA [Streptococcus thermophilus]
MTNRVSRVAVIGAGPTGVHASDLLICIPGRNYFVDLFDASPAPTSLIRFGSSHRSARSLIDVPRLRLFGNLTIGTDVTVGELTHYYDTVVVASDGSLVVIGTSPGAAEVYDALAASAADTGLSDAEIAVSRTPVVVSPQVADQPGAIVALLESRGLPFTTWQGWHRPAWAKNSAAKPQGLRSADSSTPEPSEPGVVTVAQWTTLLSAANAVPATP